MADDPDAPEDDEIVPGKGDLDEAMRFLDWSRKRGFGFQSVVIGRVAINGVRDLRSPYLNTAGKNAPRDAFEDADPDFYKEGG